MSHDEEHAPPLRPAAEPVARPRSGPAPRVVGAGPRPPAVAMSPRQVLALQRAVGNRHVAAAVGRPAGESAPSDHAEPHAGSPEAAPVTGAAPGAAPGADRASSPAAPVRAGGAAGVVVQRTRWAALVNVLLGRAGTVGPPGLVGRGRGAQGPPGGPGTFLQFLQLLGQRLRNDARQQRALPAAPAVAVRPRPAPVPHLIAAGVVTQALLAAAMRYAPLRRLAVSLGLDPVAVPPALVAAVPVATGPQQGAVPGTAGPTTQQPSPGPSSGPGGTPTRTDSMVPGLYQSVDPSVAPTGWTFTDRVTGTPRAARVETTVVAPGGQTGDMIRTYDRRTGTLTLDLAFLDTIPDRWLPLDPPMVAGRGTPLETYMTIRCMKIFETRYGADFFGRARSVHISTIVNKRSMLQIAAAIKKGATPDAAAAACHSTTYATNAIVQSGGRIASVRFSIGQGQMVEASTRFDAQTLARHGLVGTDQVPYFFDIDIDVVRA